MITAEHLVLALCALLLVLHGLRLRRFRRRARELVGQMNTLARDGGSIRIMQDPLDTLGRIFHRLTDDAGERHSERVALFQLITELTACDTTDQAYTLLRRSLRQLFRHDGGAVYIGDGGRHTFERMVTFRGRTLPARFVHTQCIALRRRKTRVGSDPGSCAHHGGRFAPTPPASGAQGAEHGMCVPIQCKGRPFGVLCLQLHPSSLDSSGGVPPAKRLLAESVARQIAFVLTALQLRQTLQNQSIRDALTGLYNRRFFEETVARELRVSMRRNEPLSLLVIDVDHFKKINDTYGHPGGDAVLQALGGMLAQHVRATDIVCRFGGEEFVILMPSAPASIAEQRAEMLRQAAHMLQVTHEGRRFRQLTISIGVATAPGNGQTRETLLEAADAALYRAKREGRDRVESATPAPVRVLHAV
jgi:diguanylate cyclase (GGDEF)-like protein